MAINPTLTNQIWLRYKFLRDTGHLDYVKKATQCEDFFMGEQWDPHDLALLKAYRRPALTINKIISTISSVLGEQIFNRTQIAFQPRNQDATSDVADALTKVFMQISDNNQLDWVRSDVFCDGVITSRGFYDVRLDFTDSLRGEVRIEQLNPKNVLIDADADEYDPDKWGDVIITKWMSPDQIEILYGKENASLLRGRQNTYFPYGYDAIDRDRDRFGHPRSIQYATGPDIEVNNVRNIRVIERQWRKLDRVQHFVDIETGDMRQVPYDWNDEEVQKHLAANPNLALTKKLIQRIRWTVIADNVVLHDDWSPYKHFTVVPYFPHFRRGRTAGLVENLIGPQELLNKVSSQELHIVNTSANSGWKVKRNALQNMSLGELEQRGAQSGLVLELDELQNIEKITPNQIPTGLDRISYKSEEHIKTISGVSDYQTGFAREDVAAKSVVANKQSGQANLAKVMDNLSRTDHILARNILDLIQEFYTEERLVVITADKTTNQTTQLSVNQATPEGTITNDLTIGEYAVVVTSQPERDTFEDSQFDQAVRLRTEVGVQIPDSFIIKASRLKDKSEIITELNGATQSPEAQQMAQLGVRQREAEVASLEADAQQKQTDAQLKAAKAQKEIADAQRIATSPPGNANAQVEAQMRADMHRAELQYELELRKLNEEMALKRERMEQELQIKREEAAAKIQLEREASANKAFTDRAAALHSSKTTEESNQ